MKTFRFNWREMNYLTSKVKADSIVKAQELFQCSKEFDDNIRDTKSEYIHGSMDCFLVEDEKTQGGLNKRGRTESMDMKARKNLVNAIMDGEISLIRDTKTDIILGWTGVKADLILHLLNKEG